MAFKIDGRKIAKKLNADTKSKIQQLGHNPLLAVILVHTGNKNSDKANQLYVNMKARKAKKVGIKSKTFLYDSNVTQAKLLMKLQSLNENPHVDGILVQLPLPKQIDEQKVESLISPSKDVDGVNPTNIGKLATNVDKNYDYYPTGCTPTGIITVLANYAKVAHTDLQHLCAGKRAVIIGRSNIVGRPLDMMLTNLGCETTIVNHLATTKGILDDYTKPADIVISATGHINTVTAKDISSHAILVDVGENHDPQTGKLCGDINIDAKKKSLAYTPVPGCVGPMTIATLMRTVYLLARN